MSEIKDIYVKAYASGLDRKPVIVVTKSSSITEISKN